MEEKRQTHEEKLRSQVKSAVSSLREEINNAFADDIPLTAGESLGEKEENSDQKIWKLTEYLLCLKEKELLEKEKELSCLYSALHSLLRYTDENFLRKKSLEEIITASAALLRSDDAVLWVQTDDSHDVYATFNGAEAYFKELLPHLVDADGEISHSSHKAGYYAAHAHVTDDVPMKILAMVFLRYSHTKFTKYELILVKVLSDLIFSRM